MEIELWDEVHSLERRMDELIRTVLGPRPLAAFAPEPAAWRGRFVPATDVYARGEDLIVRLELPGVDPKRDVSVRVEDHDLVVSGRRERTEEVREEDYYRMEACYGTFERRIPVLAGLDEKRIEATYRHGILEIVVPAAAEAMRRPRARPVRVKAPAQPAPKTVRRRRAGAGTPAV